MVATLLVMALLCWSAGQVNPAPDWTDCPSSCRCKWTQGKKSALCKDAGFTAIPGSLDSDMQVLDLAGNRIPYLMQDAFKSVGLLNLQRIFLKGAGVEELHRDAFHDLKILVEVDLSENKIKTVHQDTFAGNDRLRVLYLNSNPIVELRATQFPSLPHLRTLELAHCRLQIIHRDAFLHLTALETLTLNDNRLQQVSETVFLPTVKLKTLALDGNPWRCSCELRGFRNWLLSSNLYSQPLACHEPAILADKRWEEIRPLEFACAPSVSVQENMVQEEPGGNVTFRCRIRGDPEPHVSWLFNGQPISIGSTINASSSSYPYSSSSSSASSSPSISNMAARVRAQADQDQVLLIEEEDGEVASEKWTSLTMLNVSEVDAGEYTCLAHNLRGHASANVSLILPEVVTATTLSKRDPWLKWAVWGAGAGASSLLMSGALLLCCACRVRHTRHKSLMHQASRRKAKMAGSGSFSDQDKRLLEVSITTTTDRQSNSCEGLSAASQQDIEMLEQSLPLEVCDQPVHITIESHGGGGSHHQCAQPTAHTLSHPLSHRPHPPLEPSALVYPPPPEFSTNATLPTSAYGNIFISVQVGQDGDPPRYPDLLDLPHRKSNKSVGTDTGEVLPYFATLPRQPSSKVTAKVTPSKVDQCVSTTPLPLPLPNYDNMGPRVTAKGSCSTLSLPEVTSSQEDILPPPPPPPLCSPLTVEYVSL